MPITVMGVNLYSLKETAALLNVTPRTLHNYISRGYIKGRKIGGGWRFTEAALHEYITGTEAPQVMSKEKGAEKPNDT